jgi:hypothetical protein
VRTSNIPILTINILYALPKTPLWNRLAAAGRLLQDDDRRESNVEFLVPYETVLESWRRCLTTVFAPDFLFARYAWNQANTFPNRRDFPPNAGRSSWKNVRWGFAILGRILWQVGVRSHYRRTFWRMALPALRHGRIEQLIHVAMVSHHLIEFTRDCLRGTAEPSFYSKGRVRAPTAPLEATPRRRSHRRSNGGESPREASPNERKSRTRS